MVRWVIGSILHRVDPLSYFLFQPVLHDWCNKGCGMCYPVCGMVHIKEPLLLIGKSSLCGGSGFPFSLSEWSITTFYLWLYGIRHMVKDDSDSEKGNPLSPHRLLFLINSKGSFYMHHPTDRIAHTTAFVTPVMEHWLEREIAQWVHPMKDRSDEPSHHERTLLPGSYISFLK